MFRALRLLSLALMLLLTATVGAAFAHAGLVMTEPPDGARLASPPAAVTMTFTEPVAPIRLALMGRDGVARPLTDVVQNGATLVAPLPAGLAEGPYLLSWHITSADGHPVSGALAFSIGLGAPERALAAPTDTARAMAIWVVRWGQYGAMFFGLGSLAFSRLVGGGPARRSRWLAGFGLASVPVALALQGLDLTGATIGELATGAPWMAALSSSYAATQILFALGFALALLPWRWSIALALVPSLVAPALSGHASTASPDGLMRPVVTLHMAALLFWLGALWPLQDGLGRDGRGALARFSRTIPFGIAALLVSGAILAMVQLGPPGATWISAYGLILVAKLGLVALLLGIALYNRRVATPRAHEGEARPLRRAIMAEIIIAALVLMLVAAWRFTPPPRVLAEVAAAHVPEIVALTGPFEATLSWRPVTTAMSRAELTLTRPAIAVTLLLANAAAGIGPLRREAIARDPLHWSVDDLTLPGGGDWQVTVNVRIDLFTLDTFTGTLSRPSPHKETSMHKTTIAAAAAALFATAPLMTPALAHEGVNHMGCPTGQTFTAGDITVSGAFTRATAPNAQAAGGYFTILNAGTTADTLASVTTEAAKSSGLHQMTMKGDIMEMSEVPNGIEVPAGGTVAFAPKGYHVMMIGLSQPFKEGECVALTLHFARAGDITVQLNVGGLAQQTAPDDGHDVHDMGDMSGMSGMSMN